MISKDDKAIKELKFDYSGKSYVARLYKRIGKSNIYGEIVFASNNERVPNTKGFTREILKPYGINIPTDAKTIVTHTAVRILIETLEKENSSDISLGDKVRLFCLENKITPARNLHSDTITISVKEIHNEMNLNDRFPEVCEVLSGKKFLKLANIKITSEHGNNPSSKYSVTYEIF